MKRKRNYLAAAAQCGWRKRSFQLFRDIVKLMRDTGMRNERELYRMRIENLDWRKGMIFVPDSKNRREGERVPMSNRVFEILRRAVRKKERRRRWVFPP